MCEEARLAVSAVVVLRCEPEQQGVDDEEHREDDGHVEVHQLVNRHTVFCCRRRAIRTVVHQEVNERRIKDRHECQEGSAIQSVICF